MRFLSNRIVVLVVGGIVVGVILSFALLQLPWLPGADSKQAVRTDQVIWAITYVSGALFCLVMAVMFYAVWKFRRRDDLDDMRDGSPVHGHTGLEIFWTAIPAVIVTVFGVWAGVDPARQRGQGREARGDPAGPRHQYSWSFDYPSYGLKGILGDAHVPLDVHATIETTRDRRDPRASSSPSGGVKTDAVPGQWSTLRGRPDEAGTFLVHCAELCGPGHGGMGRRRTRAAARRAT